MTSQSNPRAPTSPHVHPAVAPARAVLFDFDYTLADSSEGIVVCMNHALGRLGLPPAAAHAIRRTIGLDPRTALGILAGEEWRSREDEFLEHFVRKADEVMIASTSFLPGAARVLRTLHHAGYRVGIVTTKYRRRVVDALERDGLRALVEVVVGADDVPRPKPAPDGLLRAAELLGIPTGDCVFVGDSEVDAMAARTAGMAFVAVLSGTTTADVFGRYPVTVVLGGVGEVVSGRG